MDDFTLNKVIEAIELFNEGKQGMKQAEEYLKLFGQQYQAWTVCIQGLALDHNNTVTFHLLRTLKQKIKYDFVSLNEIEVKEVYQSSFLLVQKYHSSNSKPIRVSSALILIYLYIYTFENQNQRLQDYLQNLSPRFIFDVLELFPEELTQEKTLVIEKKKTQQIIELIKTQQLQPCLELLQSFWNNSKDYHYQILRTYKKWLQFIKGACNEAECLQFLQVYQNCPIYLGALKAITDEELQSKAVDVLCNFVSLIPRVVAQSYQFENNVGQIIMSEIFKSFKDCQKALQDDLPDEIEQFIKLYTKVGRKFIHPIILNVPDYIQAMIKIFSDSKTDEFIEYQTTFWIKFFKTIQSMNDQKIKDKYNIIYLSLIEYAMQKSKLTKELLSLYETDDFQSKNYEEKQTIRHEMKDLIEELSFIIEPNVIISVFVKFIKTGFVDTHYSQDGVCLFESCMLLINGFINQIIVLNDKQSFQYIIELLGLYIQLNQRPDFVTRTVFKTIIKGGALLVQPILSPIFDFISKDILSSNKRLQKRATKAFEKICYENQQFVQENLEDFLKLLDKLQSIQNFEKLVKGIANAVCCNQIYLNEYYRRLCSVFVTNLFVLQTEYQKAAGQNQSIEHIITQISKNLNSLAYIAGQIPQENDNEQYKDQHQVVFSVYQQLWPILQYFIENLSVIDQNIAEKIVRFTKHTFRGSFNSFNKELLSQVFQVMCQAYLNTPISSFIYIAEVSVTVFYKYEEYRDILSMAFESLCNITFQHLPKLQSFEDHPDLTEDFFGMLVRFGRYTPQVLLQSEALVILLNLTLNAVGIEHIEAAKSYYAWLEVLFKMLDEGSIESFKTPILPEHRSKLRNLLITIIPSLLSKLFEALRKGPTDEDVEEYIIDCVIALQKIDFQNYKILLANVLEEGPQNLLTRIEKQDWIQSDSETQFLKLYTRRSLQSKLRS